VRGRPHRQLVNHWPRATRHEQSVIRQDSGIEARLPRNPLSLWSVHWRVETTVYFRGCSCSICFSFCSIIIFCCCLVSFGNSNANDARTFQGEAPGTWTALP